MLLELTIKNIALIESLRIEFARGFNVLTGETGAGKSIVVDSVNLALGSRADRDIIRTGKDKGMVQALFDISGNARARAYLDELGIETDGDLVSVRRELSRSGRNICRIFLSAGETEILDAAALVLRRCGYFYPILGILDISRITVQALGHSGRAMVAGVMEMFARAGVVILFSPEYVFNAISFADPAAWIAADLYIIPVCQRMLYKLTHGSHSDFSSP